MDIEAIRSIKIDLNTYISQKIKFDSCQKATK